MLATFLRTRDILVNESNVLSINGDYIPVETINKHGNRYIVM